MKSPLINALLLLTIAVLLLLTLKANCQTYSIEPPKPYSFERFDRYQNRPSDNDVIVEPIVNNIYSTIPFNPTTSGIKYSVSKSQSQIEQHEREVQEYQRRKQYTKALLAEIARNGSSNFADIKYGFQIPNSPLQEKFEASLSELHQMLKGEAPLELTRAQYLLESTYDHRVTYEFMKNQVQDMAYVIGLFMEREKLPKSDNVAKVMAIFQLMADTTTINLPGHEGVTTIYPMLYDFEDPWGLKDYTKTFVTKLVSTGTGNCSSLPRLFLMIAEEIGAEASLAFAPQHSYIKFKDHFGEWHNIELTNQMLTSDDHIMDFGWVKAEAIRSGIYMNAVSKKEIIAQIVNELALSYQKIYGGTSFVTKCTDIALEYSPNSIVSHQINANYYTNLLKYVISQYQKKGLSPKDFKEDVKAQQMLSQVNKSYKTIDDLGFSEIPEEQYQQWLKAMNTEANRQRSRTTQRQMMQGIK